MNSTQPFYPILIPTTPYGNFSLFFFWLQGGPRGSQKCLVWTRIIIMTPYHRRVWIQTHSFGLVPVTHTLSVYFFLIHSLAIALSLSICLSLSRAQSVSLNFSLSLFLCLSLPQSVSLSLLICLSLSQSASLSKSASISLNLSLSL